MVSRPTPRPPGGAVKGWVPCPTGSSRRTEGTPWRQPASLPNLGPGVRLISLVDFHNDCVRTSLEVAEGLGDRLYGVRLDTSEMLVDRSLWQEMEQFRPTGVNPQLVWNVRRALDEGGHRKVKIFVSGGFTAEKIRDFERAGVPVSGYGVRALRSLLRAGTTSRQTSFCWRASRRRRSAENFVLILEWKKSCDPTHSGPFTRLYLATVGALLDGELRDVRKSPESPAL